MRVKELFAFIHERHQIYLRRQRGEPKPWTQDPILQQYRFTNVYRELDPVTIWIATNWRKNTDPDVWFALTVARFFNQPATLKAIGYPVPFNAHEMELRCAAALRKGQQTLYNAAYMVRSDPGSKLEYLTRRVFTPLWRYRQTIQLKTGKYTLATLYQNLTPFYGMGSFMAAQVVADTKFTYYLRNAVDWWTWAAPGPGSVRGLNRVMDQPVGDALTRSYWLGHLNILQTKIDPLVREAKMPRISAQDLQNCLCEWDKFERTRLGEGRPKQKYVGVLNMAANFKTIKKAIIILSEEVGQEKHKDLLNRLFKETVPSGNKSYDETIKRLLAATRG